MPEGIVLVRIPFREHDEIVSLITRDFGRVDLLARGVKKITSKLSSHLEPISHILFEGIQGKEMSVLTTAALLGSFPMIRSDFTKVIQAEYAAHAVYKLTRPGNIEHGIFELFFTWLSLLSDLAPPSDSRFLDWFMLQLMGRIGFKPSHSVCVRCGRTDDLTHWSYLQGGVLCTACVSYRQPDDSLVPVTGLTLHSLSQMDMSTLSQLESISAYSPDTHRLILGSLQYHAEVKIGDWSHTCLR